MQIIIQDNVLLRVQLIPSTWMAQDLTVLKDVLITTMEVRLI